MDKHKAMSVVPVATSVSEGWALAFRTASLQWLGNLRHELGLPRRVVQDPVALRNLGERLRDWTEAQLRAQAAHGAGILNRSLDAALAEEARSVVDGTLGDGSGQAFVRWAQLHFRGSAHAWGLEGWQSAFRFGVHDGAPGGLPDGLRRTVSAAAATLTDAEISLLETRIAKAAGVADPDEQACEPIVRRVVLTTRTWRALARVRREVEAGAGEEVVRWAARHAAATAGLASTDTELRLAIAFERAARPLF